MKSSVRCVAAVLMFTAAFGAQAAVGNTGENFTPPATHTARFLYGASFYPDYLVGGAPESDRQITLMKAAGVNVVRMGESTWGVIEPADGQFDFSSLDRAVDACGKVGIKVILGTPTYSMPTWMAKEHPEFFARPAGGAPVSYGMRQNMNYDDPNFRRYAERVIRTMVTRYRDNPAVIGFQIDNETSAYYGATNPNIIAGFNQYLKDKFKTPRAMSDAWMLNYWGQNVSDWKDMPPPDQATNPSYKLEWARYQQLRVEQYLGWQAGLVRSLRRPGQFVIHDFGGAMHAGVNQFAVAQILDVVGMNIYSESQLAQDGQQVAMQGDFARSLKRDNFFVTETNAGSIGWDARRQYPPFDGQLRLDVYANIASGANMVLYWPWSSIPSGQETYWNGVIGHDLKPGRLYAEFAKTADELKRLGSSIANLRHENKVAILYSMDSGNALDLMPYDDSNQGGGWWPGQTHGYWTQVSQLHRALFDSGVGADFVDDTVTEEMLGKYKLLLVPSLYVASNAELRKINNYVKRGGHVVMLFRSGFTDENSRVRTQTAPGPLADAAGFTYQEFSSLRGPVALKGDPFGLGSQNKVKSVAEYIQLGSAKAVAYYDDPNFGKWPAITRNSYGEGELIYEGTVVSDAMQEAIVRDALQRSGLAITPPPAPVRVRNAVSQDGHPIHFYLNYGPKTATLAYGFKTGTDLLSGQPVTADGKISLEPWGVAVVQEQ